MAIVELLPNGDVRVVEPGTSEEAAAGHDALKQLAGLLARTSVKEEFDSSPFESSAAALTKPRSAKDQVRRRSRPLAMKTSP